MTSPAAACCAGHADTVTKLLQCNIPCGIFKDSAFLFINLVTGPYLARSANLHDACRSNREENEWTYYMMLTNKMS